MSLTHINGELVWWCDSCGRTELEPNRAVEFKVSLCEHAMNGEDDKDEDGNSTIWFDEDKLLHGCGDDECPVTDLCGGCWDDWDLNMPRATGPVLPETTTEEKP